jgi:hypothetical protein
VAVHEDWRVHHIDVKSTFLNRDLVEKVYVKQPLRFVIGHGHQVLKLSKALYGFRQPSRAWFSKLHASLTSLGFTQTDHEHAVYTRCTASWSLVVSVYVDDLLIAGPVAKDIEKFKQEMCEWFKMSDLGLLTYYLGIEVRQDSFEIQLCQRAYAQRLLEKMGLEDCNPSVTPMETRLHLIKASAGALVDAT